MKQNIASIVLLTATMLSSIGPAHATVTYHWIIQDNFQLSGNPIKQLDPSTCSQMNCPSSLSPSAVYYGNSGTSSGTTTGANPVGDVFVGYKAANGSANECDFAITGGTVNADGTSTAPHGIAYLNKYTQNGSGQIQPGCTAGTTTKSCTSSTNCDYTTTFTIKTYK